MGRPYNLTTLIILDLLYLANCVLKKRNIPIQKRKTKKNWLIFEKIFFDNEILKNVCLFLFFKQKRNETKFFSEGQ